MLVAVNFINGLGNIGNINQTQGAAQTSGNMFAELLNGYMGMQAGSIGDFSGTSTDSSSAGLLGMGNGMGSMMSGMGGSSESSLMMMMLLMFMASQKGNNSASSNLMNLFTGNTSNLQNNACQHQYVNAYASSMQQGIPSSSWLVANPPLTNHIGDRSPNTYRAILSQFDVENNERYRVNKNGTGDTYCNIYAWDASRAMGAEIPHYINPATGAPANAGDVGAQETNANQVNDWLNTYGKTYGWTKVTPEQAQQYANAGMPAVTSWKNPNGHGHLQMVSPSADGIYDEERGVAIAQAGKTVKNYDYASSVYSKETLQKVEYFVHI